MSTTLRLTPDEYDAMIAKGAFVGIDRRIELIQGELREMNPAGPLHFDYINFLTRWSSDVTLADQCLIQVQGCIDLHDSRPEPDITWLKPGRYTNCYPGAEDVLLLIEVAESSLSYDQGEKLKLYARAQIAEYWVIDVANRLVHQYRQSDGETFQSHRQFSPTEKISPQCQPEAELSLTELFAE